MSHCWGLCGVPITLPRATDIIPVPRTSSLCRASTESRAGDKRPAWDVPPPPPPLLRSPNEIKILTEAISRGKSEELVAVPEPAGSCQAGSPRPSAHHL